jgi:putative nucleotidyltransferase with HDIG domain
MFKKLNLVQKFIISSILSVIIAGAVIVEVTRGLYKDHAIQEAVDATIFVIESSLNPQIKESSFQSFIDNKEFLNTITSNLKDYNNVVSLKLWGTDGTILYSTESDIIGKKFQIEDDLEEALKGNISAEVTSLDKEENTHLKGIEDKLIEIYYPIKNDDQNVIAVFEIYKSHNDIDNYARKILKYVWISVTLGLFILYLLIYKSINEAYKTLIGQNNILRKMNQELQDSNLDTIASFSNVVDLKDTYTKNHSFRVTEYSLEIAKRIGFNKNRLDMLEKAALFHDIGKVGIPDSILKKEDKLTKEEFDYVKRHTIMGAELIRNVKFLSNIVPFIKYHHEKIDGSGYPEGLKGNEIPLEARIISVADTFDAITSDRTYRKGESVDYAILEMQRVRNTQLDGEIVDIFVEILKSKNNSH